MRYSKRKGILLGSTVLFTAVFIKVFKEIVSRTRPLNGLVTETGFSFPSGHAIMTTVFLGLLIYLFGKRKAILVHVVALLLVFIVVFSRVYLRVHYATDVIAGFLFGLAILWVAIWIDGLHEKI